MAKVTIGDVSRRTGLSRGTVSRALNNRADISAETRQRVLAECRKLNYVPSRAARSLATGRNYAVAAVVNELHTAFVADFLAGAIERATQSQYAVNLTLLPDEGDAQPLHSLLGGRLDGVLLAARLSPPASTVLRSSFSETTFVTCCPLDGLACDAVMPDFVESGRMTARHLCRGVQSDDVLYVHDPTLPGADGRLEGFQSQCSAEGLAPEAVTVRLGRSWKTGRALAGLTDRIRRAGRIGAGDDLTALTIMLICQHLGRMPGKDVAVMGQGNEWAGAAIVPSLSTIDPSGRDVGRRAADVLLARIEGTRLDAPQAVAIAPRLVVRDSTRHLA